MPTAPSDRHIAAAKTRLCHLAGLAAKTETGERAILNAAESRLGSVQTELASLASRVLTDLAAADRYTTLIEERGRLRMVIASAREALCL